MLVKIFGNISVAYLLGTQTAILALAADSLGGRASHLAARAIATKVAGAGLRSRTQTQCCLASVRFEESCSNIHLQGEPTYSR